MESPCFFIERECGFADPFYKRVLATSPGVNHVACELRHYRSVVSAAIGKPIVTVDRTQMHLAVYFASEVIRGVPFKLRQTMMNFFRFPRWAKDSFEPCLTGVVVTLADNVAHVYGGVLLVNLACNELEFPGFSGDLCHGA